MQMYNDSLPWLAGILEGEGCFSSGSRNGHSSGPTVAIGMTDLDVMKRVGKLIGKPPRVHKSAPTMYKIFLSGQRARRIMEDVLPFMGERRAKRIMKFLIDPTWGFPESVYKGRISSRKLKMDDAIRIRTLYNTGDFTHTELGLQFGISRRSVGKIVNKETYLTFEEVIARKENGYGYDLGHGGCETERN